MHSAEQTGMMYSLQSLQKMVSLFSIMLPILAKSCTKQNLLFGLAEVLSRMGSSDDRITHIALSSQLLYWHEYYHSSAGYIFEKKYPNRKSHTSSILGKSDIHAILSPK